MSQSGSGSGISDDSFVISVGAPLSSLEGKLKRDNGPMQSSRCIFKTPSILFRHKENAYLPNCFSIGPMHHGKENLVACEKIKIMYLNELLSRMTKSRWPETTFDQEVKEMRQRKILTELLNSVKSIEKEARDCYAEHDFLAKLGDAFVEVMVLDGCFIIELFRKPSPDVNVTIQPDDPIFSMACMSQFLYHDLILLENQIPWLVLQTLFEKTELPTETTQPISLIQLTISFFAEMFSSNRPLIQPRLGSNQHIKHILDLLWLAVVLPWEERKHGRSLEWQQILSITRLQAAGVKFKKVEGDSILDIRFNNGFLEIPSLRIQETTETSLRNLIAYEQCLPDCSPIFTCYARLLDNLIDTPNDLDILCKKEIFVNSISHEDASQYFNTLYNDTCVNEFFYSRLSIEVNQHCKLWWPTWRAAYVHNYFTKPWVVAAQIYAVIMFFLTLWQTYIKKG